MENKDSHYVILSSSISSIQTFLGVFYIQKCCVSAQLVAFILTNTTFLLTFLSLQ